MLTWQYIQPCSVIVQATATGVETGIVGASSEDGMAARTAAKAMWMMVHQGLMLLMTGELSGNLSPQTGTAPLVVAEASEVGERKAKTKGRMQVSSQIIMSYETQAVIGMQPSFS